MSSRHRAWDCPYPWAPDDGEPALPVRGVPGGWGEAWELADRAEDARLRAEAEAAERLLWVLVAAERAQPTGRLHGDR
jgi:hypothetical protein